MPNSPLPAAITGLPADRRAFLAGALASPFTIPGPDHQPASGEDGEAVASFEDWASLEFAGLEVQPDLKEARATFDSQWLPVAFALKTMAKDHDGLRDLFNDMRRNDGAYEALGKTIAAGEAYFRNAADVLSSAHTRLLSGACRALKERGETV